MSPAATVRTWWDRWKITILFIAVVVLAVGLVTVNQTQNDRRVDAVCGSLNQVKTAAFNLAKPTSEAGVTDPNTLTRIRLSNAAKASARHELKRDLACR